MVSARPAPSAAAAGPGIEERTAHITVRRPARWTSEVPVGADLRISGRPDDAPVTITVRSRPSEHGIAAENTALLDRLPGSVHGVLVVGCDPWGSAAAPARLVEYSRPGDAGTVFVSHLLLATGRTRIDVVAERPLAAVDATDDAVFAVLDSVRVNARAASPAPAGADDLEALPVSSNTTSGVGPEVDAAAVAVLQGMAGRRWNPTVLRSDAGRALVAAGLLGRFGTVPAATAAILAPWSAGVAPVTLEQRVDGGEGTRLQAWLGDGTVTVLDGTEDGGFRIGAHAPDDVLALLAARLRIGPVWTVPFRTARLASTVLDRRLATGIVGAALSAPIRAEDPVLARFWEAPWTVSSLRRPGSARPHTVVRADGIGWARVGRVTRDETAFTIDAPANLYRLLARTMLAS